MLRLNLLWKTWLVILEIFLGIFMLLSMIGLSIVVALAPMVILDVFVQDETRLFALVSCGLEVFYLSVFASLYLVFFNGKRGDRVIEKLFVGILQDAIRRGDDLAYHPYYQQWRD